MPNDPKIPDVLGQADRVNMVMSTIREAQRRIEESEIVQTANGHEDDDIYPQAGKSYKDYRKAEEDTLKRLREKYADRIPEVQKLVDQRDGTG